MLQQLGSDAANQSHTTSEPDWGKYITVLQSLMQATDIDGLQTKYRALHEFQGPLAALYRHNLVHIFPVPHSLVPLLFTATTNSMQLCYQLEPSAFLVAYSTAINLVMMLCAELKVLLGACSSSAGNMFQQSCKAEFAGTFAYEQLQTLACI